MPKIKTTVNYERLKAADAAGAYIKVLEGSSGSSKTYSILHYLIEKALTKKRRIVGGRHDSATCDDSIIADFREVMSSHFGIWDEKRWNETRKRYIFPNGSTFKFKGTQKPAKLHGPRQDIFWGNEAMELTYEAHRQIDMRTSEEIIYDFNPSLNCHWLFEKIQGRDDCAWIHSTFRDNVFLPEKDRQSILAYDPDNIENVRQGTADKWAWEVYGLGKRGRREGAIFEIYDVVDQWPSPNNCQKWGFGLDFGYSNDPAALVECCIFQGKLYLREWLYLTGLTTIRSHAAPNTPSIQGTLEAMHFDRSWKVKADGARPDQIAELVAEGYNVSASDKGPGSIIAGIDLMKRFPIQVYRASNNMQMELQQYAWKKHANGSVLGDPEDRWNHLIDAARYWALDELAGWQPSHPGRTTAMAVSSKPRRRY